MMLIFIFPFFFQAYASATGRGISSSFRANVGTPFGSGSSYATSLGASAAPPSGGFRGNHGPSSGSSPMERLLFDLDEGVFDYDGGADALERDPRRAPPNSRVSFHSCFYMQTAFF